MSHSRNYVEDRSSDFKHRVPADIAPPVAMTAHEYMMNEKRKQADKMRDWHSEAREARSSQQVDTVQLRASFSTSRGYTDPSAVQEVDKHKGFLIAGAVLAAIVGGLCCFLH